MNAIDKQPRATLSVRKTYRYNDAYSSLDDWEDIGTFRQLSIRTLSKDAESVKTRALVSVQSKASVDDIKSAVREMFRSACRCEHDCCGHFQSHASRVRRAGKSSLYFVTIHSNRNI